MTCPFDYFVILAEMRTGSNFLEANLNGFDRLKCHGELFNPHFVGRHDSFEFMGLGIADRAADPLRLIECMRDDTRLPGFRFFHDHDPRVLDHVLQDPRCAKVVLTRNPLDSYVSLQIARATGQWRLTNVTRQKTALAEFNASEFEEHLQSLQAFQVRILRALQTTGQTAFHIAYDDLHDIEVINGLVRFLGVDQRLDALAGSLKKQNPGPVVDKVVNPEEMQAALARLDRFNLSRTPNFEPRRGPSVPSFRAGVHTPILFMPLKSGPEASVLEWMAAVDGVSVEKLQGEFTQRSLSRWLQDRPAHCCFTVLRHPVARAWQAFQDYLLSGRYAGICEALRRNYGLALPPPTQQSGYSSPEKRQDFLRFLRFLKGNLAGQSAIRVDAGWASQGAILRGFSRFLFPDRVLREEHLGEELPPLAERFGKTAPVPAPEPAMELGAIYDVDIEKAARAAYTRDYLEFGFRDWTPAG